MIDTEVGCTVIHGNPQKFSGSPQCYQWSQKVSSYDQEGPLQIGHFAPQENKIFISSIPKKILGIGILQGQNLQTSFSEFCLQFTGIKPVLREMYTNTSRSSAPVKHEPVKQYKLPGREGT